MIGMHPELFGFPELSIFRSEQVRGLLENPPGFRGLPSSSRTAGLARALAYFHEGDQSEGAVGRARRWLEERVDWASVAVFDHLLDLAAPAVGVEKSPEDSSREDFLGRLAAAYPRARYVHLTRHPVTTVQSMERAWSGLGFWDIPGELFNFHLLGIWLFTHLRIKRFTDALPPERWLRVRAEDLLATPRALLPEICRWLGVDDGEESVDAMVHPERSPFAHLGPAGAAGGNDPGFLFSPVMRPAQVPDSLQLPAEWTVDPWTYLAVVQLGHELGYGPASGRGRVPRG
jgi:hypothetical protein